MKEAQEALNQLNSDSVSEALKGAGKALQEAGEKLDSIKK
jgi:hypothetical protein